MSSPLRAAYWRQKGVVLCDSTVFGRRIGESQNLVLREEHY